jgi:hypothetical protein
LLHKRSARSAHWQPVVPAAAAAACACLLRGLSPYTRRPGYSMHFLVCFPRVTQDVFDRAILVSDAVIFAHETMLKTQAIPACTEGI